MGNSESWSYAVFEYPDYILISLRGEFTDSQDMVKCAEAAVMAAMNRGHTNLLVDKRAIPPNTGIEGAKALYSRANKSFMQSHPLRVAAITSSENLHVCLAIEELLQGIGINYRAFHSEDQAREWLLKTAE